MSGKLKSDKMVALSLVKTLYIITGVLEFLLNLRALTFLISNPQRPIMPIIIYGLSDTLSGALAGVGLLCDGCLYFANLLYSNSCARYFLIYSLLLFPLVTSSFSALGVAIERYQGILTASSHSDSFLRTFSLMWVMTSWFIALAFMIVLRGHTKVLSVYAVQDNEFYWEKHIEIRNNRGLLEDMWEHNSQHDWSSDYRENVIIGLIYGIVGGNISHAALEKFRGIPKLKQKQTENLQIIKRLHVALGITDDDRQRVFGELSKAPENINQGNNDTILNDIQNPIKTSNEKDNFNKSNITNSKTFKPTSITIIKNLQNNSLMNATRKFQTSDVEKQMEDHEALLTQVPNNITTQITQANVTSIHPLDVQMVTPVIKTVNMDDENLSNKSEVPSVGTKNIFDIFDTREGLHITTELQTQNSLLSKLSETKILTTEYPYKEIVSENIKETTTTEATLAIFDHNKSLINTSISTESYQESYNRAPITDTSTMAPFSKKDTTMEYTSQEELENVFSNATYTNKILSNIREKQHASEAMGITETFENNEAEIPSTTIMTTSNTVANCSDTSLNNTTNKLPFTTEDRYSNIPPATNSTSTACQAQVQTFINFIWIKFTPNFLPIFMTALFVMVFLMPLSATAGLYTRIAWLLCHHPTPLLTTVSTYSYWSHSKKAIYWEVVILIVYFSCWMPFLTERLLYAWDVINDLPSILPATLFLLAHIHSLLRGIFYMFNHTQVLVQVCDVSAATAGTRGCTNATAAMEGANMRIHLQDNPILGNTAIRSKESSRAAPQVPLSMLHENTEDVPSSDLHGNLVTPPLSNLATLPNMPDVAPQQSVSSKQA
nr:uncharacterized protein LOC128695989 [Cherax quadricarinatus]